jgi:WD40 repeat protein
MRVARALPIVLLVLLVAAAAAGGAFVWRARRHPKPVASIATTHFVNSLAVSPAGDLLAAAEHPQFSLYALPSGNKSPIVLEGAPVTDGSHRDSPVQVAFTPRGERLVGLADGTVYVWSMPSGKLEGKFTREPYGVVSFALSPDGGSIVTAPNATSVDPDQPRKSPFVKPKLEARKLGDLSGVLWTGPENDRHMGHLAWSSRGDLLAIAFYGGSAELVSSRDGTLRTKLSLESKSGWSELAFAPDGSLFATANDETGVLLWSAETGSLIRTIVAQGDRPCSLAFSADGDRLLAGYLVGFGSPVEARLFSARDGSLVREFAPHGYGEHNTVAGPGRVKFATQVALSSHGEWIVEGGTAGWIQVWPAPR